MVDVFPAALLNPADNPARQPPPLQVIPDQWYAILPAAQLCRTPVPLRRLGEDLVVYRTESGRACCAINRCPHRGVALSLGQVVGEQLECRYHAFRFAPDGQCTSIPCDGPDATPPPALCLQTFPCREAHGLVWIWWGRSRPDDELPPLPWLPELEGVFEISVGSGRVWPVPAYRAIESMFDFHHAPVLHGRGPLESMRRFVPEDWSSDERGVHLVGMLRDEAGARELRMECTFLQPCVSYLKVGTFLRILSIDVPIDGASTWRYSRHISPVITPLPALTRLIAAMQRAVGMTLIQDPEDLRVIVTQAHLHEEHFGDVYVSADVGCAQVMRQHHALLRAAAEHRSEYPPHVRARLPPAASSPASPRPRRRNSRRSSPAHRADDPPFTVVAARSGAEAVVEPGESVVDALARAGVTVRTSCHSGRCGTCISRVVEGEPDHRDLLLSPAARRAGQITPCVSRSRSPRLVLDL